MKKFTLQNNEKRVMFRVGTTQTRVTTYKPNKIWAGKVEEWISTTSETHHISVGRQIWKGLVTEGFKQV